MTRFLSACIASVTLFSASVPVLAETAMKHDMNKTGNQMSTMGSNMMHKSCPKGQMYVKGYTKKDGSKVKGYCRK